MRDFSSHIVANEHKDLTVESYLKQVLHCSGRRIQRLTRQKGILLNRKPTFLQKKLKPGDVLKVLITENEPNGIKPEHGIIENLYEDNYIIVLNKPPRLLVHPAGRTTGGTLANFLAFDFMQRGIPAAPHAVHRLDRDTSGCIIFAKDSRSQFIMSQQLAAGIVRRTYWALVSGVLAAKSGTIEAPIGPHPCLPNRRSVSERGEPAVTHYRVIREFSAATLLELTLETGRTHQIRVHMEHIGHPVIGDGMYGNRVSWMPRQALHAASISFSELASGEQLTISASIPADFAKAVRHCESTN